MPLVVPSWPHPNLDYYHMSFISTSPNPSCLLALSQIQWHSFPLTGPHLGALYWRYPNLYTNHFHLLAYSRIFLLPYWLIRSKTLPISHTLSVPVRVRLDWLSFTAYKQRFSMKV